MRELLLPQISEIDLTIQGKLATRLKIYIYIEISNFQNKKQCIQTTLRKVKHVN